MNRSIPARIAERASRVGYGLQSYIPGGQHPMLESDKRVTDVWSLPTSSGKNGHGAEFALAFPGRCIALASVEGDLVLDPFVGSGTTALAAMRQGRRCIGFDISDQYVQLAERRIAEQRERQQQAALDAVTQAAQLQLEDAAAGESPPFRPGRGSPRGEAQSADARGRSCSGPPSTTGAGSRLASALKQGRDRLP